MMVRLVWMIGVLMSGRDLTRAAYDKRFPSLSDRTYRRDLVTLREAGFRLEPLIYLGGTGSGVRLITFRPELEAV
jgi:predicted DNA-binding transcriptional regulator YafY